MLEIADTILHEYAHYQLEPKLRELRAKLVELFNKELLSSGLEVNEWPKLWYEDINFFQKEVMEPKQSVHIRPKFYTNNISNDTSIPGLLF